MITEIHPGPLPTAQAKPVSPLRRPPRPPVPPSLGSALTGLFMAVAAFYCQPRPCPLRMPPELCALLLTMHVCARSKQAPRSKRWLLLYDGIEQIRGSLAASDPAVFRALAQANIALLRC